MKTLIAKQDNITEIRISGRLDSITAPEFDRKVSAVMDPDEIGDIVIDCRDMEYISSAGLRSLITLLKGSKVAGRTLELHNISPSIRSIFDMTGFSTIFKIR